MSNSLPFCGCEEAHKFGINIPYLATVITAKDHERQFRNGLHWSRGKFIKMWWHFITWFLYFVIQAWYWFSDHFNAVPPNIFDVVYVYDVVYNSQYKYHYCICAGLLPLSRLVVTCLNTRSGHRKLFGSNTRRVKHQLLVHKAVVRVCKARKINLHTTLEWQEHTHGYWNGWIYTIQSLHETVETSFEANLKSTGEVSIKRGGCSLPDSVLHQPEPRSSA